MPLLVKLELYFSRTTELIGEPQPTDEEFDKFMTEEIPSSFHITFPRYKEYVCSLFDEYCQIYGPPDCFYKDGFVEFTLQECHQSGFLINEDIYNHLENFPLYDTIFEGSPGNEGIYPSPVFPDEEIGVIKFAITSITDIDEEDL